MSEQKGLAPILIIFLITAATFGFLIYSGKINLKQLSTSQNKTQTISNKTDGETKGCKNISNDEIFLEKMGGKTFLKDKINNYQLDISLLPEAEIPDLICKGEDARYEVDMYKKRDDFFKGSTARFSVNPAVNNDSKLSLEDFAKQKLGYIKGKHTDGGYYGNFTSSPLISEQSNNGFKMISWVENYTDAPTHQEGTTAGKYYVISVNNKIVYFKVISWDKPSFDKAVIDFDQIVATFKSP